MLRVKYSVPMQIKYADVTKKQVKFKIQKFINRSEKNCVTYIKIEDGQSMNSLS